MSFVDPASLGGSPLFFHGHQYRPLVTNVYFHFFIHIYIFVYIYFIHIYIYTYI